MEREIIIEVWDEITQIMLGDEVVCKFEFAPELYTLESVLSALGYNVEIIDKRFPVDLEDADEAFYDKVIDDLPS